MKCEWCGEPVPEGYSFCSGDHQDKFNSAYVAPRFRDLLADRNKVAPQAARQENCV